MAMIHATPLNALSRRFSAPHLSPLTRHPFHLAPIPRSSNPRKFSSSRIAPKIYVRFGGSSKQGPVKKLWGLSPKEWAICLGVAGVLYYVIHLEQVPETGRWRFMTIPRKLEERLYESVRDKMLEQHAKQILPPDHIISRHVRRVTAQILSASNLGHIRDSAPDLAQSSGSGQPWDANKQLWDLDAQKQNPSEREWEVVVVHDPKVINAISIPGCILVSTGILPFCKDEHGLAAVLSHEIGHAVARHGSESLSSSLFRFIVLFPFSFLFDIVGISYTAQFFLFDLPNSRTQEYEADKIGLTLMSRACYDPRGAVEVFTRLQRSESTRSNDFFDTHPLSTKRVEEISKILPEAYAVLQRNPDCAAIQDRFMGPFRSFNVRSGSWSFDE